MKSKTKNTKGRKAVKWEYLSFSDFMTEATRKMNEFGNEGWEVTSIILTPHGDHEFYLKRKKP